MTFRLWWSISLLYIYFVTVDFTVKVYIYGLHLFPDFYHISHLRIDNTKINASLQEHLDSLYNQITLFFIKLN